ncbi:dTMP kinase [Sphingomonas sp. BT553]|uniref:Thymidylate kinase n=1 Tax=Sphingomonas mollis TaxID=2795726 RepID=A0ABS0XQZ7_9SPHN|nr:dTMP kinase [Sphingomonas sp. BT553]MBJ6122455.1 dTMP kinase [Sphingomonas sp. BT553]
MPQHASAFLLAIEGGDGAGKATAAAGVAAQLNAAGRTATVLSFPRYTHTLGGHVLGDYLAGRLPHTASPRAMATLYALDRLESAAVIAAAAAAHEVVVFDRYIASNMAYQAAQVPADDARDLMAWIARLEVDQFGLPVPDLSVYLDTPADIARTLILQKRSRSYTDDALDAYEADFALQTRVRTNYALMAAAGLLGRWATVPTIAAGSLRSPLEIATMIVDRLDDARPDR